MKEYLLYKLASSLYKRRISNSDFSNNNESNYWGWQKDTSEKLFKLYRGLDVHNKKVLDIGCGVGGRTCYISDLGASKIVGIDINEKEINSAKNLAKNAGYGDELEFVKVDTSATTIKDNYFDVILLVDSMEHVESPLDILLFAYDKLKIGGYFYFGTIGWYHHQATHMRRIVPVPFLSVFFF